MIFIILASLALQLAAAGFALRLMFFTRLRVGWALVATAIVLMEIRRVVALNLALTSPPPARVDAASEWIALSISFLLVAGLAAMVPWFRAMKESEERMRASESRLQEIAGTIRDVFWTMDPLMTRVLYSSPGIEHIWGKMAPEQRLDPATYMERVHPEDRERVKQQRMLLIDGRESAYEYRIVRPDGTTVHVRTRGYPVIGPHGVERIVGVTQDLTELRDMQQQFLHAQKMEALGRLSGGVAHDFNNLLTVILGFAETAHDELPAGHPARASLKQITVASERAAQLTRHLLAFSRKQAARPVPLDINQVIQRSQSILQRVIGEDVTLETRLQPGLWPVFADPGQFEQVLMNLAVNARDAMPRGGKLTIETSNFEVPSHPEPAPGAPAPGRNVRLTVTDNGLGMDSAVRGHIFEPFFTTKEPGKGTGLGLSTVYGIVTQAEGTISVHSEPGRGAAFTITLPTAAEIAVRRGTSPPISTMAGRSETILVAEDEPEIRNLVVTTLQRMGHRVLSAPNGAEALKVAAGETGGISLVVSDSVMPGMSGREMVKALREKRPEIRVLFVSGYPKDEVFDKTGPTADEDFLAKPFTPAKLSRAVREMLEGTRPGEGATVTPQTR